MMSQKFYCCHSKDALLPVDDQRHVAEPLDKVLDVLVVLLF
jgi:hypothetical protein